MSARTASQCDGCGQVDDHPKLHYAAQGMQVADSYHHDCLPFKVQLDILGPDPDAWDDGQARVAEIIEQAKQGVHGKKLLAHIEKMHAEVEV